MDDDLPVLSRRARFEVLARKHEVMFVDGTAVALHPVRENGHDSLFHRAIVMPNGLRVIFDLRQVCPPLARELPVTPARDVVGTVYYSLRHAFRTTGDLVQSACRMPVLTWTPAMEALAA